MTLLELLLVLTIIGISAVLFPMAIDRALPSRRVQTAADEVAGVVRETVLASRRRGDVAQLAAANGGGLALSWRDRDGEVATIGPRVPVELHRDTGGAQLVLFPDGSSSGGSIEIAQGIYHVSVQISGLTGRVLVEPVRRLSP